ncbi:GNAT family N-acetyltransferase [Myceligenerans xiligouense]|uniref:Ribosomal protein S18 acetylase RimI-like enzyme n=1 Tax=Myceligenerans xiligouense TaxID=253184 RepID=A0A3N4ZM44_9MICO|nr:GNAT family N-acetyltransferase [Myceligenerans xiligouense]RPF21001.1 ribosomal protein S18 acetylase RimI-like enzyme [Myceligenerans xiligouense]
MSTADAVDPATTDSATAGPSDPSPPDLTVAERAAPPATLPEVHADGLTWRGARREDAPAVLTILNHLAAADNAPFRWSLAEIEERLAAPYRDLDRDFLLGVDGTGALHAFADVHTPPGDETVARAILQGGVHPTRRGEGIGRELLAWQIARGRQKLAASALADRRVPAWLVVHMEDEAPETLGHTFERAGFAAQRYYSDLRRDLSRPIPPVVAPPSDSTLRLVPWTPELDEPTRLARNDAFRDHWGSQPQTRETWAEDRSAFMPAWTYLVVDDAPDVAALLSSPDTDEETAAALRAGDPLVVAYQVASKYVEDFEVRGFTFGYSDNVGVRRAYRGRGLAPAVMAAGMRAMADDGMQYAALDVDTENPSGAVGLYAALGYEKQGGSRMLTIEL